MKKTTVTVKHDNRSLTYEVATEAEHEALEIANAVCGTIHKFTGRFLVNRPSGGSWVQYKLLEELA